MDLELKDKVVIVTGGAKGIGAAIVRLLAGEGAVPVIVDRDGDAGAQLQNEVRSQGAACDLVTVELANPEDCSRAVDQAVKTFGRLDALVNNAGRNDKVGLEQGNPREYVASLERNLVHYYSMAHYALPHLKRARGAIVNIGSKHWKMVPNKIIFPNRGSTGRFDKCRPSGVNSSLPSNAPICRNK